MEKEKNPKPKPKTKLNPAQPLFSLSPRPSKRTSPAWPNPHARVPLHTSAQLAPACSRSPASFGPQPSQRGPRKPPRHPAQPALRASPADSPGPAASIAFFPRDLCSTQRPRQFRRDPRRVSAGHARPRCPGPLLNGPAAPAPPHSTPPPPQNPKPRRPCSRSRSRAPTPPVSTSTTEIPRRR